MFIPTFEKQINNQQKIKAQNSLALAAIQIERFIHKHGYFPKSLDDLPADITAFYDPYTDKNLQYLPQSNSIGYLLFSSGKDCLSDYSPQMPNQESDDIIWGNRK